MSRLMRLRGGASRWMVVRAGVGAIVLGACGAAWGQQTNPVYMDDSAAATETLSRARDHIAGNNIAEAVRVLQTLLEQTPDRVVPSDTDPDLFVSVRDRVQRFLLETPELLEKYRQMEEPLAADLLAQGHDDQVERAYLLTTSGFEGALRVAQMQLEGAQFEAARLTLAQLDAHPDRRGAGADQAARLMALVACYLDRDEVWSMAQRWGAPNEREAAVWPAGARRIGQTALDSGPQADLNAMLGKPLRSVPIGTATAPVPLDEGGNPARDQYPENAKDLRALPTVAGDTLYLNDGVAITAWDRITLARKWQVTPGDGADAPASPEEQQRLLAQRAYPLPTAALEEPCMVSVSGRDVLAATGIATGGQREGDARVHAIDAVTGKLRWSVAIDIMDPALASVSVRGPVIVSEGVAVVAARRNLPERRLMSLHLVALDLKTGQMLWHRLVGSAGSLPWGVRNGFLTDAGVLDQGIVYRADALGVIGAYQAVSGRPVWVRRIEPQPNLGAETGSPWQMSVPVLDGESLIMLTPDRQRIARLDRRTGVVLGACRADRFLSPAPQYLVKAGRALAAVGADRVAIGPIDTFETSENIRQLPPMPDPGIRGRVIGAGSKLLVPTKNGLSVVNTENAAAAPVQVPLDSPGNVLALPSQLVVVDDAYIHSYLLWEVAERVLSERMTADPSDPSPAVTLAELSYRANKHGRILGAVDAALAALKKNPDGEQSGTTRARLFESLHVMVSISQEPAPTAAVPAGVPGAPAGADDGGLNLKITDQSLLAALVDRMGKAAVSADERVSYLLTLGRMQETRGRARDAIDTYQSVLDDQQLAGATWTGPRLSVRGELEATRRITKLVREKGTAIYAAHEAKAAQAIAALGSAAGPDDLVALATRYPVASGTPALWARAADAYQAQDRAQAVVGALEAGLEAAERLPESAWLGALAGRLVTELDRREQLVAAAEALRQVRQRHPDLVLTVDGAPVDASALGTRLGERLAARHRWAKIGKIRVGDGGMGVQAIPGWTMLEPLMTDRSGSVARALVMKGEGSVALWAPGDQAPPLPPGAAGDASGQAPAPISAGELAPVWKRQIDLDLVDLVKIDSESALLFFASGRGGALEKVTLNPAQTRWRTDLFVTPLKEQPGIGARKADPTAAQQDRAGGPADGLRLLSDLVITMDDRTIVVAERGGRAMGLDAQSGEVLWHETAPLDRVYDADLSSGTLVMGGDEAVTGPGGNVVSYKPQVVVLDGRTGKEMQRIPQTKGKVRWLRLTGPGTLVCGLETAVVSVDLSRGQTNWTLSDYRLAATRDAWVFDDRLFLLDRERRLWLASVTTGRLNPDALDAPRAHLAGIRPIEGFALSDGVTAFSTYQGVLLYGADGALKGVDAVGGFDSLLPPRPAQKKMVTISTMPDGRRGDSELVYTVHMLDSETGMLIESTPIVMGAPPRSMTLLDGRIAVTAGGATVVLPAPGE